MKFHLGNNMVFYSDTTDIVYLAGLYFFLWRCDPWRVMATSFLRFLDHTQQRTTVGRIPLDEWSARRRDLYLTKHVTHNTTDIHAPGGIRTHDLSRWAACGLRPLTCWDRGFKSHRGHGYLSVVIVVCCQVEVSATSWSLVQRNPTDCGSLLCVI